MARAGETLASPAVRDPDAERRAASVWVGRGLLAALVLLFAVVRFVTTADLWLDEALSANISALPLGDIGAQLRHDGHPPLFYWLLHGWMALFGEGDTVSRALAGIFGVAALPLAYVAARRLGGARAALAAVVLAGALPFWIRYSTELRMYSLVMLLVLAGQLLVRASLQRATWPRLAGLTLVSGALLLSHYWAIYLVAATVLVLAVRAWRASDAAAVRAAVATAAGGVLFLPWLPVFLDQLAHTGTPWAEPFRPTTILAVTIVDLGGFSAEAALVGVAIVGLVVLAVFGAPGGSHDVSLSMRPRGDVAGEAAVVALTLGMGAGAALVTGSGFASRYAAVIVPLVVLLAAVGVSRLPSLRAQVAVVTAVTLVALPGIAYNVRNNRTQGGQVVAALNARAAPDDVVVYCPDQLGPAGSRHLRRDVRAMVYPTGGAPGLVDWSDYEERNRAADPARFAADVLAQARGHAVFLVSMGGYRTFGAQCEQLAAAFAEGRSSEPMVSASDSFFEPMNLARFSP